MDSLAHDRSTRAVATGAGRIGGEPLWRVGGEALRKQLANIREQVGPVRAGDDAEAIHQMRVATRRLRTMAHILQDTAAFRRGRVNRLRRRLRPLARRLGVVRDLDILLQRLDQFVCEGDGAARESGLLRDKLVERRARALRQVRQALRQRKTRRLVRHPRRAARRLVTRTEAGRRMLVRQVAGSALWSRYEAILRFADVIAAAGPTEQLHALRIACKQLRYALELFSEEDDARAQALMATLKEAQDQLCELQDSVFAVTLLTRLGGAHLSDPQLDDFRAVQAARRDTLQQGVAPYWERISAASFREELAALIGAL